MTALKNLNKLKIMNKKIKLTTFLFFLILCFFFPKKTTATSYCPLKEEGDINCDDIIDENDISFLSQLWDLTGELPGTSLADFNGDQKINEADLTIILYNFGAILPTPTPPPSTPSPTLTCPDTCPDIVFWEAGIEPDRQTCYVKVSWKRIEGTYLYYVYRNSTSQTTEQNYYTWRWVPCDNNSLYKVVPAAPNCPQLDCSSKAIGIKTPPIHSPASSLP